MPSVKIACLGGGSLYFPHVMTDMVMHEGLAASEIVLYDIDPEKVELMAGCGRRLTEEAGTGCTVRATIDLADAVDGADFALSAIGGSGAEVSATVYGSKIHNADVEVSRKYGIEQIVGDTAGPAGMMMGLRAVPVYIRFCREMEKRCPGALLLNHSNPMAVLMRAMHKHTSVKAIGICHGVQGGTGHAARVLGVPPEELKCIWIGTNHYYWFTKVMHNGRDVTAELLDNAVQPPWPDGREMSYRLSKIWGHTSAYPSDSHTIEFHPWLAQASGGPESLPYGLAGHGPAGAEQAKADDEALTPEQVRKQFLDNYKAILDEKELPPKRAGGGEALADTIADLAADRTVLRVANTPNRGAIPNLPAHAEVEVEAVIDSRGIRPVYMGEAPGPLKGILEKRFAWQELVVDAAVTGDRNLALQALLIDEMSIWPEKAQAMLEELLGASRELLPGFFKP
ncbi:MAG: family 4 glycosyl hydrolase [Planctomycetota bacterium]|jgi:alpha-galactosidase